MGVVAAGGAIGVAGDISGIGGFDGPVTVAPEDAPRGFTTQSAVASGPSAVLHLEVTSRVARGSYKVTIVGVGMDVEHRVTIEIVVRRRA